VFFSIVFVGDQFVLVRFDLPLPRIAHGRRAPIVGVQREAGEQPFEILALTRWAPDRRILRA
jgi:hypothetical protein